MRKVAHAYVAYGIAAPTLRAALPQANPRAHVGTSTGLGAPGGDLVGPALDRAGRLADRVLENTAKTV
jgi:hypothetical protein